MPITVLSFFGFCWIVWVMDSSDPNYAYGGGLGYALAFLGAMMIALAELMLKAVNQVRVEINDEEKADK